MRSVRGQMSWFVALGVVFVVMVLLLFGIMKSNEQSLLKEKIVEKVHLSGEADKIDMYIEGCILNYAEEALILSGKQSGRINTTNYITFADTSISSSILSNIEIQNEISDYVAKRMEECDLSQFEGYYKIENNGGIKVSTRFIEEKTAFMVDYPLKLVTGKGTDEVTKDFKVEVPVRGKLIYEVARQILDDEEYILSLDSMKVSEYLIDGYEVYVISDKKSDIKGKSYKIMFAKEV